MRQGQKILLGMKSKLFFLLVVICANLFGQIEDKKNPFVRIDSIHIKHNIVELGKGSKNKYVSQEILDSLNQTELPKQILSVISNEQYRNPIIEITDMQRYWSYSTDSVIQKMNSMKFSMKSKKCLTKYLYDDSNIQNYLLSYDKGLTSVLSPSPFVRFTFYMDGEAFQFSSQNNSHFRIPWKTSSYYKEKENQFGDLYSIELTQIFEKVLLTFENKEDINTILNIEKNSLGLSIEEAIINAVLKQRCK